ncbi:hypothetical protein L9F63_006338, partial [Diploptera punctata]
FIDTAQLPALTFSRRVANMDIQRWIALFTLAVTDVLIPLQLFPYWHDRAY